MKFEVSTEYLPPIELGRYEHVRVALPDGRQVTVFSDAIYVAAPGRSERKIWEAMAPGSRRYPYGKVRQPAGGENLSDEEAAAAT